MAHNFISQTSNGLWKPPNYFRVRTNYVTTNQVVDSYKREIQSSSKPIPTELPSLLKEVPLSRTKSSKKILGDNIKSKVGRTLPDNFPDLKKPKKEKEKEKDKPRSADAKDQEAIKQNVFDSSDIGKILATLSLYGKDPLHKLRRHG
jgi:hypothetical protein